jgi:hypothetical protein
LHWGAVGDSGSSYGPFQLHRGGALGSHSAAWANSPAGIEYAIRQMAASGARGLKGRAAIAAIVRRFERPADPQSEIARAWGHYGGLNMGASPPAQPMGAGAAGRGGDLASIIALLQQQQLPVPTVAQRTPASILGSLSPEQQPMARPDVTPSGLTTGDLMQSLAALRRRLVTV